MNSDWPGWIMIAVGSWFNPCFLVMGVALLFFRRKGKRSNPFFGEYADKVGDAVYTATFEDGIYQVGGHKQVGVAYAVGGVLRTCRHVTGGGDIICNGRAVSAYQESLLNDTVCYGGPWQLEEGNFKGGESVTLAVKDPKEASVYVYEIRLGFTSVAGTLKGFIGHATEPQDLPSLKMGSASGRTVLDWTCDPRVSGNTSRGLPLTPCQLRRLNGPRSAQLLPEE